MRSVRRPGDTVTVTARPIDGIPSPSSRSTRPHSVTACPLAAPAVQPGTSPGSGRSDGRQSLAGRGRSTRRCGRRQSAARWRRVCAAAGGGCSRTRSGSTIHSSERVIRDRASIRSARRRKSPPAWNGLSRSINLHAMHGYILTPAVFTAGIFLGGGDSPPQKNKLQFPRKRLPNYASLSNQKGANL